MICNTKLGISLKLKSIGSKYAACVVKKYFISDFMKKKSNCLFNKKNKNNNINGYLPVSN